MREIYPICDETSYKKALEEMEPLFDNLPAPNSEDEIWLDSMVTLVEADEKKKYRLILITGRAACRFISPA